MDKAIYNFKVKTITGEEISLETFKGKTLLFVNVASKCGFTPQYTGLEKIYQDYKDKGLVILGFPCNQFGSQEPGSEVDIQQFCSLTYNVSFPMFSKIDVNGDNADPLYKYLKSALPGVLGSQAVKWNFTKFLVDKNGEPVKRYASKDSPEKIAQEIEKLL